MVMLDIHDKLIGTYRTGYSIYYDSKKGVYFLTQKEKDNTEEKWVTDGNNHLITYTSFRDIPEPYMFINPQLVSHLAYLSNEPKDPSRGGNKRFVRTIRKRQRKSRPTTRRQKRSSRTTSRRKK
jgi:hypothetical protein